MTDPTQEDEYFDPKYVFPIFRPPSHETETTTENESERMSQEHIFNPIIGGHLNFTSQEDDEEYPGRTNEEDENMDAVPSDIYLTLVIVSVSLIVLVLLSYALYKAVVMLKVSLNDGREDSVTVPRPTSSGNRSQPAAPQADDVSHLAEVVISHPPPPQPPTSPPRRHVSLVAQAQNTFIQGIRNFQHPAFMSTLRRSDDDEPPPYDEPSPPPYHIAIQMRSTFDDGLKFDPIKIQHTNRANEFDSISLDSGDVTDGIKREKYVSVAVVV